MDEEKQDSTPEPNPQDEIFIQRGVYQPATWKDYYQEERDKVPLAQQVADKQIFKLILLICLMVCVATVLGKYAKHEIHDFSAYEGSAGTYLVRGNEIKCPDGSICTYAWEPDPYTLVYRFVITYPNGFRINVTPVGNGGGVTTYDSDQDATLTPYMEKNHSDVKNAMLEHHGHVTDISAGKFIALPILLFAMVCLFMPYQISDMATFMFINRSERYHSLDFYSKVQKCGAFLCCATLLYLLL